jgi:hypothetical protein
LPLAVAVVLVHPTEEISDELDEIQVKETNGQFTQIERDAAFCARMRWAIEAGLENWRCQHPGN